MVGAWLGFAIRSHWLVSPVDVLLFLSFSMLGWLVIPAILVALVVSGLAWILPLYFDSVRLRIGCVAVTLVLWVAITGWGLPQIWLG